MIGLIKDLTTLQKYVKVSSAFKVDSFKPFIVDAQIKYLSPHLGDTLLEALDTWYNAATPQTNAAYTALLPYVQAAVAKFTLAVGAPSNDTVLTESGFAVIMNQNLAPASTARVQSFVDSMLNLGWNEVEQMLRFLEKNKANYSSWTSSSAYTEFTGSFITTAVEFDKIIRIDQSRLKFMQLKPIMDDVELLRIEPVISKAMADDIKAKVITGILGTYSNILPMIKRAVANFTFFADTKDKKYEELGDAYLSEVKLVIDATPTDYPLYAASTNYDADKTSYKSFENKEDNKFFVMGG